MPEVRYEGGSKTAVLTRGQVKPGQVFSIVGRDGKKMAQRYAAIGHNGKAYSINLATGGLASTDNDNSRVAIVGTFTYDVKMNPNGVPVTKLRSQLADGDVFVVRGSKSGRLYAHMGALANPGNRWLSVNLGTRDHAIATNGGKRVNVTGKLVLNVKSLA